MSAASLSMVLCIKEPDTVISGYLVMSWNGNDCNDDVLYSYEEKYSVDAALLSGTQWGVERDRARI